MFSALFFSRVVNYLKSTSHLDQMEQDANTITAGDFTVEMDISHAMWDKFKDEIYPKVERDDIREEASGELFSPALYLKKYLSEEIGQRLTDSLNYRLNNQAEQSQSAHKEKKMAGG